MPAPGDDIREQLKAAPEQAAGQMSDEARQNLRRALRAGQYGAGLGALAGVGRTLLQPPEERSYLLNTLAGTLLGGLGAGGTAYIAGLDPFQQASPLAKSFEAGRDKFTQDVAGGAGTGQAIGGAVSTALNEYLSGKHEFTPDQQRALIQQFVKSRVPTSGGWRNRANLAQRAAIQLQQDPRRALQALVTLHKVAPDQETKAYVGEAIANIRRGGASTPEGLNALATTARMLEGRAKLYDDSTKLVDSMNVMKELYGSGQLSDEELAKNVGLLTGRFGSQSGEAEQQRRFIQSMLANPIQPKPETPYPAAVAASEGSIGQLIARATR